MLMERLHLLYHEHGQSPWLDNLRRDFITSGHLANLRDAGVRGLTSNPTIFAKAIMGSSHYDVQLRELVASGVSVEEACWELVIADIHGALEVFASVHHESSGVDGFVSVEVDPELAHDTNGTTSAARALHQRIDRPNLMVKIPATPSGLPAIRQMIAEGRNVNVTLIFSIERYRAVMQAYVEGLEQYAATPGADLSQVASVASFFVSRVDTEVDRRLDDVGTAQARALQGRAAVAQAVLAYEAFTEMFSGSRWEALERRGARVQRPLWASTSTKNPAYPDTLYVDALIGPHTVNTLPDATLEAFAHHGALARTIDADVAAANSAWHQVAALGVDLDEVSAQLEREGLASFQASFRELLDGLSQRMTSLR
jgi:transaldolase